MKWKEDTFFSEVTLTYPELISIKQVLEISIGFDKYIFIL